MHDIHFVLTFVKLQINVCKEQVSLVHVCLLHIIWDRIIET